MPRPLQGNDTPRLRPTLPRGRPRQGHRPSPIRPEDLFTTTKTPAGEAPTAEQLRTGGNVPDDVRKAILAERFAKRPAERRHRDLPDPAPPREDRDVVRLQRFDGRPFIDRADPRDVQQGYLGDCYFMASLAAIAKDNPRVLENAIRDNGDGTYRVRFYDDDGRAHDETVDADFWVNARGRMRYGRSLTRDELWPALIEKAYAQWKGGYGAIESGKGKDVFRALMGQRANRVATADQTADQLWARVRSATRDGRPMVADTYGTEKKYLRTGIADNHVYTVLGTQEEDGHRYVILRNPWADTEYENGAYQTDVDDDGDGRVDGNDGIFRMRIEDFKRLFEHTDTTRPRH
jgi:hypothetical protein